MIKKTDQIVYRGMTLSELTECYDDYKAIPNLDLFLQKNRERAQAIKEKLNPVNDIAYCKEPLQKLDIYAPRNAKDCPVLIDIHGGSWQFGSKNARSIPAEAIMDQGIIWVSVDYGLAPKYRMDQIIAHIRCAVQWVFTHIHQFGGDYNRLYVSGHSAGAHLAATTTMPGWHNDFAVPENIIKGLIGVSGIYDLEGMTKSETQETLQLTPEESRSASPFYHLPTHAIPCILGYGAAEPLMYSVEAHDYAEQWHSTGNDVSLIVIPNANHFETLNELANSNGELFKAVMEMILT